MHLVVNTDEHIKERKACREGLNCYLTYELVVAQSTVLSKKENSPNIYNPNLPYFESNEKWFSGFLAV